MNAGWGDPACAPQRKPAAVAGVLSHGASDFRDGYDPDDLVGYHESRIFIVRATSWTSADSGIGSVPLW